MWTKFRTSSTITIDKEEMNETRRRSTNVKENRRSKETRRSTNVKENRRSKETRRSTNVNEEYLGAMRRKSYTDFFYKVQLLVKNQPKSHNRTPTCLSETLLEPGQETITSILDSSLHPNTSPNLKSLLFNYFDISAEASKFCSHLLKTLTQLQTDCDFVTQITTALDNKNCNSTDHITSELNSYFFLDNPFTNMNKQDFKIIHDKHSSVLQHLKTMRKRVARKVKFMKFFNKASGVCVATACGILAAVALFLAMHTLTALLMGPMILSLPIKPIKKKIFNVGFFKNGLLKKIGDQLDVAAKGAYILNRDFDTMSRLVARLQDEIEHSKEMIRFCMERREDRVSLQVMKEMKKRQFGFRKQVEELEEHVYLCLVTINRARSMLINEISRTDGGLVN